MLALSNEPVTVRRFIRNLRGGSQPILTEASDGHLYIVKLANNLQSPNLAFNESMGTELYRALNLPISSWRQVQVTDSFLDQNPGCWTQGPAEWLRPTPGLRFGSRYLGEQGTRIYEILPGSFFTRVRNLPDFWLAWLVDVCAGNGENRQAIFCEVNDKKLNAVFIDHGHMFSGSNEEPRFPVRAAAYLDLRVYRGMTKDVLMHLRKSVARLKTDMLCRQAEDLPGGWKTNSALQCFAGCLEMLQNEQFVREVLSTIVDFQRPGDKHEQITIPTSRNSLWRFLRSILQAAGSGRSPAT